MYKRTGAERTRPHAVILGNSRAEIGFDPRSPAWPASTRPVFNLALPGGGINAALDELSQVLTYAQPKLIVVGLDFLDFRVDPATPADSPPIPADRLRSWRERLSALLSIDALADSIATLRAQRDSYPSSLDDDGFNPMRDYVGISRREGYYAMFRQRDQENAQSYVLGPKTIYRADHLPTSEFRAVERMIEIARGAGAQLRFVLYPVHAHTLVLFHQAGLWPAFEAWKRELAMRVEGAPPGTNVELWDFSGFSPYAVEDVPPTGDTSHEMRWYWEAGHFKSSLGDVVLASLLESAAIQPRLGRRLSAHDLEEHLQSQRMELSEYERTHARDVAELAALVEAARSMPQPSRNRR